MTHTVSVTIIIPCLNEERFIEKCLDSVVAQDYPKDKLEVLVVDGMSNDGTRELVKVYADRFPFVELKDNPKKVTPAALNIGIRSAKGEVIVRMDAHAEYPRTYISTCVEYLKTTGADVVGGPVATIAGAETMIARSIALATSHPFGVGNSRFRISPKGGYVDTVPFGAYKREVFQKIGFFDERLIRNQDNELSTRITRSGGCIYLTPDLTASYYSQPTIRGLLNQALRTGMWNVLTIKINPAAFRWRHFFPFFFVTALLALGFFAAAHSGPQVPFLVLVGLYLVAAVLSSIQIGIKEGMNYAFLLPVVFFLYHICYGLGTWVGLLRAAFTGWRWGSNVGNANHGNPAKKDVLL
jgi:glycosyltransferase involved in cell wall biosynthesis